MGFGRPGVVLEIVIQLVLEKGIVAIPIKGFGHFVKTCLQIIGDKLPAVSAEETGGFGSGEGSGRHIHGSFLILGRDTTTKKTATSIPAAVGCLRSVKKTRQPGTL